jgi:hypothetical protein
LHIPKKKSTQGRRKGMARLNKNSKLRWKMIKILKGKNLNLFSFFSFFFNVLVHLHFGISHLDRTAVLCPN